MGQIWEGDPPFGCTIMMPCSDANAMLRPFGDQSGCRSSPGEVVSGSASPPPTRRFQMSMEPDRSEAKTIHSPSGDQLGDSDRPFPDVNGLRFR